MSVARQQDRLAALLEEAEPLRKVAPVEGQRLSQVARCGDVCRNTCGVSSIGAPRRWPGVTPLGLSRLSRPRIAAAIGHDPPACFSASPISSSALLPIS